jgi:hypothetical protein
MKTGRGASPRLAICGTRRDGSRLSRSTFAASREEEFAVAGRVAGKPRKLLLVTGAGRSGTKYMCFVLKRLGLDVRHERLGRDGIASWSMAVDAAEPPWGVRRSSYEFAHVLHQVRHPLATISSCTTFKDESWRFICEHVECATTDPVLLRAAKYWLLWNERAEDGATSRLRVEDLPLVFPELCERLGIEVDASVLARVPTDVNTRSFGRPFHVYEHLWERLRLEPSPAGRGWFARLARDPQRPPLTWEDLDAVSSSWAERIRLKAREYGYTT